MSVVDEKSTKILKKARAIARKAESWIDFSNQMFNQRNGVVAQAFVDDESRDAFYQSDAYQAIREIMLELMRRADAEGRKSEKSGKFVVRVPKTLHSVLEIESKQEGVSLNQLVTAKLSASLKKTTDVSFLRVAEAFRQVHEGYSADRVIVDPDLNARYLGLCRDFGLMQDEFTLNRMLYDIRKSKKVSLPPTTVRTQFNDYDLFAFASEIAVRVLQRAQGVSLDDILCDPSIRSKFDEHAQRLSPEQPALKLRCAALNLRKSHRLKPIEMSSPLYRLIAKGPVSSINLDEIPEVAGAYAFYDANRPVFASETANLRRRLDIHFKHSGHQGLPNWLGVDIAEGLALHYVPTPDATQDKRLQWLQTFINMEKPVFNFQLAS